MGIDFDRERANGAGDIRTQLMVALLCKRGALEKPMNLLEQIQQSIAARDKRIAEWRNAQP